VVTHVGARLLADLGDATGLTGAFGDAAGAENVALAILLAKSVRSSL
jgi:hypothetical protein